MNRLIKILLLFSITNFLFPQFGKNKVQYDNFEWYYIKTEHFNVYFYDKGKDQAEFVAFYAEEAYNKISNLIGWELSKNSDIFVYNSHNDFQQTNIVSVHMGEGVGGCVGEHKVR